MNSEGDSSSSGLFADLPDRILAELRAAAVRRAVPRNVMLFLQGDPGTSLYEVVSGKLKAFVDDERGNQVILNVIGPGEYFGELALIDGGPRSASVVTLTDTTLDVISQEHFQRFLEHHPEAAVAVSRALVFRIRALTDSVRDMALLDVYGRIVSKLQKLAEGRERIIHPRPTHQELASMVGSSREMVSRIMRELITGGYVEQASNALYLKRPLPPGW
jgi:CRP/FNR family cyclic AMP-dependent transcriptional regulator